MKKFLEKFDGKLTFWVFHQNRLHIGKDYSYCKETAPVLIFHFRWIFVDIFGRITSNQEQQVINCLFFTDAVMKLVILLNTNKNQPGNDLQQARNDLKRPTARKTQPTTTQTYLQQAKKDTK